MLAIPALGQTAPLKTRILTISTDQPVENVFFLNDGKAQPFVSDHSGQGEPMPYTGPRQFVLHGSAEEFAAKPPLPVPLASAVLPEHSDLVLLVADRPLDGKTKLTAYDVDADGFQAGDYRVFNISEKTVSLIFGRSKSTLKAGEDRMVSDVALQDKVLDVVVQTVQVEEGKLKRVYSSAWGHQPVQRNYVFLFNGSHPTRPVAIRSFSDHPKPAPLNPSHAIALLPVSRPRSPRFWAHRCFLPGGRIFDAASKCAGCHPVF